MSQTLSSPLPAPGSLRTWLLAARPQTLPVAVAPVAVGAAVASVTGPVRWGAVLAALFGALAIQIGTNLANDVFDYEKGADDEARLGPPRAVQSGLLSPRAVRAGMDLDPARRDPGRACRRNTSRRYARRRRHQCSHWSRALRRSGLRLQWHRSRGRGWSRADPVQSQLWCIAPT